jgi:hypothetical protein
MSLLIILPSWVPDLFVVNYDRYTYLFNAFAYMLCCLLIGFLPGRWLRMGLWAGIVLVHCFFTFRVNNYWKASAEVIASLVKTLPEAGNRVTILLDLPQNMNGVHMIGATPQGEFRLIEELGGRSFRGAVYDAAAFNMLTPQDGATAEFVDDTTVKVTLNQWGTWWWYNEFGANSYETPDYKIRMVDPGHWYELILKRPSHQYLLLYQTGGVWKQLEPQLGTGKQVGY